ncbi:hypothetical protein XBKB1_2020001 [Xenorhabdus bovienii str. kraussei Becker Underwood]|uniref:Uncharacterized protein n=1 Tax=Xenorhabdus bovienii str. kraussei Becker Underwood TaxID=1398204 RepID=A0A077PHF1_XENBV|nr:hypothetical protein XBKB1_2020001 [Xenorhabdus bovienii str. kraussei Becker Underwood]
MLRLTCESKNDKNYHAKNKSKHIQLKQIGKTPFHYIIM